jgi:hypothetical protein
VAVNSRGAGLYSADGPNGTFEERLCVRAYDGYFLIA